ncbi:hypothetical protein [Mesorhizobium sp.]|uniref:hypothetical protein n=1 Tax=Mesorhizobium sp. TaxID=1871066 RepID=UPI000FE3C878|nr:hypothetical protein [Mesorhizobium sp.]RWQ18481.1 MAG: hypothetical protein EOR92_16905 [Mesorhizobium sp.]
MLPILRQERRSRPDLLIFWAYWRKNVLLEKAETALIAQLGGTGLGFGMVWFLPKRRKTERNVSREEISSSPQHAVANF